MPASTVSAFGIDHAAPIAKAGTMGTSLQGKVRRARNRARQGADEAAAGTLGAGAALTGGSAARRGLQARTLGTQSRAARTSAEGSLSHAREQSGRLTERVNRHSNSGKPGGLPTTRANMVRTHALASTAQRHIGEAGRDFEHAGTLAREAHAVSRGAKGRAAIATGLVAAAVSAHKAETRQRGAARTYSYR